MGIPSRPLSTWASPSRTALAPSAVRAMSRQRRYKSSCSLTPSCKPSLVQVLSGKQLWQPSPDHHLLLLQLRRLPRLLRHHPRSTSESPRPGQKRTVFGSTNSAESNKRRCLPCPTGWELPHMLPGRLATGVASPLNKCPVASPPKQQCSIIHAA